MYVALAEHHRTGRIVTQRCQVIHLGLLYFQVTSAKVADAVLAFAFAVKSMYDDPANEMVDSDLLRCDEYPAKFWKNGRLMLDHTLNVTCYFHCNVS